jgi:hypothetical protein
MGAQLFTPLFADPHGEPGGSSCELLPPELLLDDDDDDDELLDELVPIPQGAVLDASSEHALFSRHVACDSVGFFAQIEAHVSAGSGAPHSFAFASQRDSQLAASVLEPLDPPPLDDDEPLVPLVPVVLDEHATASEERTKRTQKGRVIEASEVRSLAFHFTM